MVSRDLIGRLHARDLLGTGPRSPQRGAPYTFVTTEQFLIAFDLESLRDLSDKEQLLDAGLSVENAEAGRIDVTRTVCLVYGSSPSNFRVSCDALFCLGFNFRGPRQTAATSVHSRASGVVDFSFFPEWERLVYHLACADT